MTFLLRANDRGELSSRRGLQATAAGEGGTDPDRDDGPAERGEDAVLAPAAIAEAYYQVHCQPRSAWTHELDLRAFSDLPWWNH